MEELDFKKYNISHLEGKEISKLTDCDIEKIMDAFAAENLAPAIYEIDYSIENINKLLNLSHCRRCGRCCLPNPIDPDYPGVMVLEEDLRMIARHTHYSYKYLKKKAILNKNPELPRRRYLPLPCMFYNKKKKECEIYEIRPLICRTFPITDLPGKNGISINLMCEYGKDIYRSVINKMKDSPNSRISL